jgi:hypothetical protein
MEEGSPDYPGQAVQVTRQDAMPGEVALPDEIIEPEDQPANSRQRDYGCESFEHRLSPF